MKLSNSAYSTKFENLPFYLSKGLPISRKNPEDRKEEIRKRQEEIQNSREGKDNITDFIDFKGNFHHKL